MKVIDKILVGCLLFLSFLLLFCAGAVFYSMLSLGFLLVSVLIFGFLAGTYEEKLGKFYSICEKVYQVFLTIVFILFLYANFFVLGGVLRWISIIAVVVIIVTFTKPLWDKLRKKE